MSKWRNDFIKKNQYTRPGLLLNGVKKIVLHWTANPGAGAVNHVTYFGVTLPAQSKIKEQLGKKATYASAHIFVDSKEAVCIIPLNEVAYHANDHYETNENGEVFRGVKELNPNANKLSVGVEMCLEKDGTISSTTIQRTVEVIAELCKMYKLSEKDIVRHYDVTHKNCPAPFVKDEKLFVDFKKKVRELLNPSTTYPGKLVKVGSKGKEVESIQKALKVAVTGIFDGNTTRALKEYQKINGLVADGIVGPKTWSKLF